MMLRLSGLTPTFAPEISSKGEYFKGEFTF